MEIREPFGSGILRYRGIEAIRQNPPRGNRGALDRVIPQAEIQPVLCASKLQFQSTVGLEEGSSATKYRCYEIRCTEGRLGCEEQNFFCPSVGLRPTDIVGNRLLECAIVTPALPL